MSLCEDGVGDRKNPKAGGAGRLYFDDIRVTKAALWGRGPEQRQDCFGVWPKHRNFRLSEKENAMSRKRMYLTAVTIALLVGGVTWAAHDVTAPGDPIQGIPNDGVSPGNNAAIGWPGNEGPDQAIDNQITTKYLHFKGEVEPAGFRVTPKRGPSVVTGIRLSTANDAVERDPVAWELSGSNNGINGPYTLIAKGPITDFVGGVWARRTWNATPIAFANTVSYTSYQLILSPVSNPGAANSMQIAEVELLAADLVPLGPKPADGAQGVTLPLLQWTPGDMALFEDVYVGTSPDLTDADRSAFHQPAALKMNYYAKGLVPGTKYYWRVDDIDNAGKVYTGNVWSFTASPLSAYSPSPRDGDKWLSVTSQLSWQPGQNGIKHDLFFGTDKAKVEARDAGVSKGTLIAPTFDPGALTQNTTYYWVVDETTTTGTKNPGQVWSFTTIGATGGGLRGNYFVGNAPSGTPALSRIDSKVDLNSDGCDESGRPGSGRRLVGPLDGGPRSPGRRHVPVQYQLPGRHPDVDRRPVDHRQVGDPHGHERVLRPAGHPGQGLPFPGGGVL